MAFEKSLEPEKKEPVQEEKVKEAAEDIYWKRIKGEEGYEWEKTDAMLRQQGIEPGSEEAGSFMEKWDWHQAESRLFPEVQEKTSEQILDESRENFARVSLDTEKSLKQFKKIDDWKNLSDKSRISDVEFFREKEDRVSRFDEKNSSMSEEERKEYHSYLEAKSRKYVFMAALKSNLGIDDEKTEKVYQDMALFNDSKSKYLEAIKIKRAALYEKSFSEAAKDIDFTKIVKDKHIEAATRNKMEEVFKETVIKEAANLYDKKMELEAQEKKDPALWSEMKNYATSAVEKYRKMPGKYKIMISAGLFGGGVLAGAVGGATGAALAGGVFAGRWFQRMFGGASAFVGLEALIKKSQERKEEKNLLATYAVGLSEILKNNSKDLDEELLKLEGAKKKQKYWRFGLAGAAGVLIGSGMLGKAFHSVAETINGEEAEKIVSQTPLKEAEAPLKQVVQEKVESALTPEEMAAEPPPESIEIAKKGDSVWKMIERQMQLHYGEKFDEMDAAKKTFAIDAVKDKVMADPAKFGLDNPEKIKIGQKIDFSEIFDNKQNIDQVISQAESLKTQQIEDITNQNKAIGEWIKEHPQEKFNPEKVEEILKEKTEIPEGKSAVSEAIKEKIEPVGQENPVLKEEFKLSEETNQRIKGGEVFGLNQTEYGKIEKVRVHDFLNQVPPSHIAWDRWRLEGPSGYRLPHEGSYDTYEFRKHVRLADYMRSLRPGYYVRRMTIEDFLRMYFFRRRHHLD